MQAGVMNILPKKIQNYMLRLPSIDKLQEIRIRINKQLMFLYNSKEEITDYIVNMEDINTIIQRASDYSIYAFEEDMRQGYITITGGHRLGLSGNFVVEGNKVKNLKKITFINIRICREYVGCSDKIMNFICDSKHINNTIVISPPKCGKTTLIRDISRNLSCGYKNIKGRKVSIIDERSEIASCNNGIPQLNVGDRTDVFDSCTKSEGIMMAIRAMSPEVIVCDEIGTEEDVKSILSAVNAGVSLVTTIHGNGCEELHRRRVFKDILEEKVFNKAIVLKISNNKRTAEIIDLKTDKKEVVFL